MNEDKFRFADMLEKDPAYAPIRHHRPPLWDPTRLPGGIPQGLQAVFRAAHVPTLNWGPKDVDAEVPEGTCLVEIDANGAFVAAASSATFAHCALEHTGAMTPPQKGAVPPGYYLVDYHPWQLGAPGSPLGAQRPKAAQVWVPHTIYQPLRDLTYGSSWALAGHWPDCTIYDSWTSDPCRFDKWYATVRDIRTTYKRLGNPDLYDKVKHAYSQAVQMWRTPPDPKGTPREAQKKKNKAYRPDWHDALHGQHFANMWRRAYQATVAGRAPLRIHGTDRMVIQEHHLLAILRQEKGPIRLDETGVELGTFDRKKVWYAGIEGV